MDADSRRARDFGRGNFTHTEGTDSRGQACWFWSDAPKVPTYRAQDCAEGRECLERLRQLYEVTRVRGSREEKARRTEMQAQKVKLLKGSAGGSSKE
jgi:hypothetical protein